VPHWSAAAAGNGSESTAAPGTPGGARLVDVLETAASSVEARFLVADDGFILGVDLWPTPDADPCEVRFSPGSGWPETMEVRHGDEVFDRFRIERIDIEAPAGDGQDGGAAGPADGGTT